MIKVTVWNEFQHEKTDEAVSSIYPEGIHKAIADFLADDEVVVRTATLDDPDCGLTKEVLDDTDVLIWWGHMAHDKVPDEVVERCKEAIFNGMGAIFLHSAHMSKLFRGILSCPGTLCWREDGDLARLWVCDPSHPIARGLGKYIEVEHEEMYSEPFGIPEPDRTLFISWYEGGEAFRSGATWQRGYGKIFYFQPGHETYPTYYNKSVQQVIKNAVRWAKPDYRVDMIPCPWVHKPGEEVEGE